MGFIKTDPSQTKAVVALLGVLVVTVGVGIVRLKPAADAQATAQAQQASSSAAPVSLTQELRCDRSRNPFEKPVGCAIAQDAPTPEDLPGMPSGVMRAGAMGPDGFYPGEASVQPMDIRPAFAAKSSRKLPSAPVSEGNASVGAASGTVFTLLATAKSGDGYSAVIKIGDSAVRVVEVGDVLDGGFRVLTLEPGRAVLSDGRETIVAKRPQS